MRVREMAAILVVALVTGCFEQGGGGGAAEVGAISVSLVPRMTEGEGEVSFTPSGANVEVRVSASELPRPYAYSLRAIRPGEQDRPLLASRHVWQVPTADGQVDYAVIVPRSELARWKGVELVHLPSGEAARAQQAHPALVASIPSALKAR